MHALNLLHLPEYELGLVVRCVCIVLERTDLVRVYLGHVWICLNEFGLEFETFLDEVIYTELTAFAARFKIGIFNDEVHCFLDKAGSLFLWLCITYQVDLPDG